MTHNPNHQANQAAEKFRRAMEEMASAIEEIGREIEEIGREIGETHAGRARIEMPASKLMAVERAARYLGIGKTSMYEMVNRGEIPTVTVVGKKRIDIADLELWIDGHRGQVP